MAVSAQHFKVLQIGSPVFDPPRPRPLPVFRADLLVSLQMVQFQNPNVRQSAPRARAAEVSDDLRPGAPVGFLLLALVDRVLAFGAAVAGDGRLAAAKALATVIPSAGRVTAGRTKPRLLAPRSAFLDVEDRAAKLASLVLAVFRSVGRKPSHSLVPARWAVSPSASGRAILSAGASGEGGAAFGASVMYRLHGPIIARSKLRARNFDIACKRVDKAARQPDLFTDAPKKPTQEAFI